MNTDGNTWEAPYRFFQWLSSVPRKSRDEKQISDALMKFAEERGLAAEQDKALNVLIHKPGSPGREEEPPILLQAHMDMVFETEDEEKYPYGNPLRLVLGEDGDTLTAEGTTLGADDGSGMAIILALLDDTGLSHPPIDGIFTMNEEDGLEGAGKLSPEWIRGDRMINLDGEVERSVICGCAGAFRATVELPVTRTCKPENGLTIEFTGLHGGHSGLEIDKGYQNAILLMGRVLSALGNRFSIRLVSIDGGKFMNAIPVSASASLVVSPEQQEDAVEWLLAYRDKLVPCLVADDQAFGLSIRFSEDLYPMTPASTDKILRTLLLFPDGVQRMSPDIPGLVQTSSNLGI
ncbi:MAG: M20/M25/M40 family metallo-hydrolase, partial [Mogibacterium sp.]|nr:M20/M25/M40 family metallo-hydrolase [Mogibacterium sp.]